jgi:hypothetical protein
MINPPSEELSLLGGVPPPPKADTPLAVAAICEAIDRPALMLFRKTKASAAITEAPAVANAPAVPVALAAFAHLVWLSQYHLKPQRCL